MFMKVHNWKIIHAQVEELQRPITASDNQLVLVDLGPGQVVKRIVCIEPAVQPNQYLHR
jgi:hypothetical protein